MGSVAEAQCECGYEGRFQIGGGMGDFHVMCLFPCLCRSCKQIVSGNLLAPEPACPKCESRRIVLYDQAELIGEEGSEVVNSWTLRGPNERELKLTNGRYYCPSCDTIRLTFVGRVISWD
jgi:Zn finger protein HypA/HybF involved in hydrogenase expression